MAVSSGLSLRGSTGPFEVYLFPSTVRASPLLTSAEGPGPPSRDHRLGIHPAYRCFQEGREEPCQEKVLTS